VAGEPAGRGGEAAGASSEPTWLARLEAFASPHLRGLYLVSAVCGLVDAACFLTLGGVFAEMMTGNLLLLFIKLGAGQWPFAHGDYLMALGAFALGALLGGRVVRSGWGATRHGFVLEWAILAAAVALSLVLPLGPGDFGRNVVVATLALAMGLQNALLRRHGVPDLATNVMTLTLAAAVADSPLAGGANERLQRRVGSIASFALMAMVGAALATSFGAWAALAMALLLFTLALTGLTRQPA
jgi:uncharacterized membrane protein YoaK (UPF0700 family)